LTIPAFSEATEKLFHFLSPFNHIIEIVAVVLSVIYVILASKEKTASWPAAIISVTLYIYLCYSQHLFLESWLQTFYLIMGVYGWYQWSGRSNKKKEIHITSCSLSKIKLWVVAGILLSAVLGYYFAHYTSASLPYLDSPITVFSVIATWMLTRKIIENWLFWIIIDAAAVFLYARREMYLTSLLYILYVILAVFGYFQWKKELQSKKI